MTKRNKGVNEKMSYCLIFLDIEVKQGNCSNFFLSRSLFFWLFNIYLLAERFTSSAWGILG